MALEQVHIRRTALIRLFSSEQTRPQMLSLEGWFARREAAASLKVGIWQDDSDASDCKS